MRKHEIHVCIECKHPSRLKRLRGVEAGKSLFQQLDTQVQKEDLDESCTVRPVACLGNCKNRCRISVTGDKKWSWLLGRINPEKDIPFLVDFLKAWLKVERGLIPKADRSEWLVKKALGRFPPMNSKDT